MAVHLREVTSGVAATNHVFNDIPSGSINGTNKVFTLSNTPVTGTVRLYLNGVLQEPNQDYNIAGKIITFIKAPRTNSNILAHYIKST